MKKSLIFILAVVLQNSCLAQSDQIIVHDPVAIESEGKYYMFSTGYGVASWQSDDMVNWHFYRQVFDTIPSWCKNEVPLFDGNIWAPDISFHNGQYYLYYSISSFKSNRSAIGVAVNKSLDKNSSEYRWVDHGLLVESYPGRDHWNAIDPNLAFDDNGIPWLSFGSFWGGIKLVRLNKDLVSIAKPEEWKNLASRERTFGLEAEDPGDGAIEAPFIIKKDKYYYLFVSFDLCCRGSRSTYNVRVGRSETITGPYIDKDGVDMNNGGGSLVIGGDEDYYGIGHNSVYEFNGKSIMYSHAYDMHDDGRPKLLVHKLSWDKDLWPYVEIIE